MTETDVLRCTENSPPMLPMGKSNIVKHLDDVRLTPKSGHCEPIVAPSRLV
jgi:hypothetical protein